MMYNQIYTIPDRAWQNIAANACPVAISIEINSKADLMRYDKERSDQGKTNVSIKD